MGYKITILIVIVFYCCTPSIMACSGFCVYSDKPLYGMNFDYPDTKIKFLIQNSSNMKIFHMQFKSEDQFYSSVGMNNKGLFCSEQEQWPYVYNLNSRKSSEIYFWTLYNYALSNFHSTDQVIEYLSNRKLIHSKYPSLHLLVGDRHSNAVIIEAGNNNAITSMQNKFLVMTNFRNADFLSHQVYGEGADRYKTAHSYISKNIKGFGFNHGIKTLKKTIQSEGPYQTLCSMLFSPTENLVYIILKRDFNRIWKLSIDSGDYGTIETFQGFDQHSKLILDSSGILASELVKLYQ